MRTTIRRFGREDSAASMVEYALMVALIAAGALVAVRTVGERTQQAFASIEKALDGGSAASGTPPGSTPAASSGQGNHGQGNQGQGNQGQGNQGQGNRGQGNQGQGNQGQGNQGRGNPVSRGS